MMERADFVSAHAPQEGGLRRTAVIASLAFLTLVDLFAMQAVLPSLIKRYEVSPAATGLAVNSSTIGMAVASLVTSILGRRIDRRHGVAFSLALLALPTMALASAPDLAVFAALRIAQGLCMACAFTLMLAHLGERYDMQESAGAFAAYIAGNVASNLVGRLLAAGVSDHFGLNVTFYVFAGLNLAGAALAYATIGQAPRREAKPQPPRSTVAGLARQWRDPALRASCGIGFLILFAFIGTFTYVNLVLVAPPLSLGMMQLGTVYFVFAPSIATTLAAGLLARRAGPVGALWLALALATCGLPLLVVSYLPVVLAGLVLVAIGTFAAQAVATGIVGRLVKGDRGAASGLYLASYFAGGLAGSATLGQIFERFGWGACVAGIGLALALAALLALRLRPTLREN